MAAFSTHQLSLLAWSFAELRHLGEDKMLVQLEAQAGARLADFDEKDLVQLLKALLDLNRTHAVRGGMCVAWGGRALAGSCSLSGRCCAGAQPFKTSRRCWRGMG